MARIRWHGQEFSAEPVRQLPNGNWIMKALAHGARFTAGSEIEVTAKEIVEMAAAETPASDGAAALQAAMDEERKALPTVQELIKAGGTIAHDAPDKVVSVPPDPIQPPQMAAKPSETDMNTPKLNSLTGALDAFTYDVEKIAGSLHDRMRKAKDKVEGSVDKLGAVVNQVEATADKIDDAANQMTNGGPPLEGSKS